MKYLIMVASLFVAFYGCSRNSGDNAASNTIRSGNLEYTFTSPRSAYRSGDTLVAKVTVHNLGMRADTIGVGEGLFS